MKKLSNLVERSFEMIIASYYLARCGEHTSNGPARPPAALGVVTWKEAYNVFYNAMGDGREPLQLHIPIEREHRFRLNVNTDSD